jgi:hypothetical protein
VLRSSAATSLLTVSFFHRPLDVSLNPISPFWFLFFYKKEKIKKRKFPFFFSSFFLFNQMCTQGIPLPKHVD